MKFKTDNKIKRTGFTLAEVLITLGIIGVVAAMTMPSLVASYQKKSYAARVKQSYSQLSQAIKLSEVQNGDIKDWDLELSSDALENTKLVLQKYILPYFNGAELCENPESIATIKRCGNRVSVSSYNFLLNNGVSVSAVAGGKIYAGIQGFILAITMDVDGPKGKNILGHDRFYFFVTEKGVAPFGMKDDLTREDILRGYANPFDGTTVSCKKVPEDGYRHACTALLMIDNWEFKNDYPW